MDGTPCTIQTEPDRHGVNMALRIVDRDGNEVASCFYSEGNTPPIDVVEKTTAAILRAINMHGRLVAFVETMKRDCEKRQDTGSCEGCFGTLPGGIPCDIRALLKEARGEA